MVWFGRFRFATNASRGIGGPRRAARGFCPGTSDERAQSSKDDRHTSLWLGLLWLWGSAAGPSSLSCVDFRPRPTARDDVSGRYKFIAAGRGPADKRLLCCLEGSSRRQNRKADCLFEALFVPATDPTLATSTAHSLEIANQNRDTVALRLLVQDPLCNACFHVEKRTKMKIAQISMVVAGLAVVGAAGSVAPAQRRVSLRFMRRSDPSC